MAFSIASPDLERLVTWGRTVEIVNVYQQAASDVADYLEGALTVSARAVGVPDETLEDLGTYHNGGEISVGIPSGAPGYAAAFEAEYGTLQHPARPWLRPVILGSKHNLDKMFGERLTERLAAS